MGALFAGAVNSLQVNGRWIGVWSVALLPMGACECNCECILILILLMSLLGIIKFLNDSFALNHFQMDVNCISNRINKNVYMRGYKIQFCSHSIPCTIIIIIIIERYAKNKFWNFNIGHMHISITTNLNGEFLGAHARLFKLHALNNKYIKIGLQVSLTF